MIDRFTDHAANDRTFLAWVRTGIAVIAFGFVVEKFNLFVLVMAGSASSEAANRLEVERLAGPFGRYDGMALIVAGLALIVLQTVRYIRTARMLDDPDTHTLAGTRDEVILSVVLVLVLAGFSAFLVLT
jgi:inner membrane protein YidH